jgi:hypothetical protein
MHTDTIAVPVRYQTQMKKTKKDPQQSCLKRLYTTFAPVSRGSTFKVPRCPNPATKFHAGEGGGGAELCCRPNSAGV